jgi:hypothetical protein
MAALQASILEPTILELGPRIVHKIPTYLGRRFKYVGCVKIKWYVLVSYSYVTTSL